MQLPFPTIGILFNIDELKALDDLVSYGYSAKRVFMQHVDPSRLSASVLLWGDTRATMSGSARTFCMAVSGVTLDVSYVKKIFNDLEGCGLAPRTGRFAEKPQLDSEPLVEWGRIDASGALSTASWDIDDHRLCKKLGWAYRPRETPRGLPADLRGELKALKGGKGVGEPSSKKWWQIWKR